MQIRILLLLSILLFIQCSPKNQDEQSLLSFVPENASVVVKINDFKTFTTELDKNALVKKLLEFDIFPKVSESLYIALCFAFSRVAN